MKTIYTMSQYQQCPLCKRECLERIMQQHHLETRRESSETEEMFRECHKTKRYVDLYG